jgi:hypothetical protein
MGRGGITMKSLLVCALLLVACGGEDGGEGKGNLTGGGDLDACELLTEADATALFGEPAEPDEGTLITDPAFIGDCLWTWEPADALGSQNVSLTLWEGEEYYAPHPDAEPFEIGDEGSLHETEATGIQIDWVQDGVGVQFGYFSVGDGVPDNLSKSADVQALALEISERM